VTSEARKMLGITGYKRSALEGKMCVRRLMPQIIIIFLSSSLLLLCGGGGGGGDSGSIGSSNSRSSSQQASLLQFQQQLASYQPDHTVLISLSSIPTHCIKTPLGAAALGHASANDQQFFRVEIAA
jgi:hypothetical protein